MATKKVQHVVSPEQSQQSTESPIKGPRFRFDRALEPAFESCEQSPADEQKALQSIAFLLEWASSAGNLEVDGYAALGLSRLLRKCAIDIGNLYTQDDVWTLNGDPLNKKAPAEDLAKSAFIGKIVTGRG